MTILKPMLIALALTGTMAYANCEQAIQQEDPSAIAICQAQLEQAPSDGKLQYLTGLAYDMSGQFEKAFELYHQAAEQGDAKAQYNLGTMYTDGQGVKKDYVKAAEWYQKSAEQGYAEAQFNLAVAYRKGQGVTKDKAIAKQWFGKSCDSGIKEACTRR